MTDRKRAPLKTLRPKIKAASPRIKPQPVAAMRDATGREERAAFYATRSWRLIRRDVLGHRCLICRAGSRVADHVLGHRDYVAAALALHYGLAIPATWEKRFYWRPAIIPLCRSCHDTKSTLENRGHLERWIAENFDFLAPTLAGLKRSAR